MSEYRFYKIGPNGPVGSPEIIERPDDVSAVNEARKLIDGTDIEVWQGTRIVAYLVPELVKADKKA